MGPCEQAHVKGRLERTNRTADRGLGDAVLVCGGGEGLMARCGLEHEQVIGGPCEFAKLLHVGPPAKPALRARRHPARDPRATPATLAAPPPDPRPPGGSPELLVHRRAWLHGRDGAAGGVAVLAIGRTEDGTTVRSGRIRAIPHVQRRLLPEVPPRRTAH